MSTAAVSRHFETLIRFDSDFQQILRFSQDHDHFYRTRALATPHTFHYQTGNYDDDEQCEVLEDNVDRRHAQRRK